MKMKNAILSGIIIGVVSVIWVIIMHFAGINPENVKESDNRWLEYTSVIIPIIGLYLGIRGFKNRNNNSLTFFEGVFEGFKIMAISGLIAGAFSSLYFSFLNLEFSSDYMERIFGAAIIGFLVTLASSLLLMTKPKQL
ncbi:DUF4199 domain-containing protein [Pedobacter puniceum]|jgi:uncharacterized membrane protein|uniref:DUF4199 family protein n=1 Tax=Pedobacter puniceum TaxID=2666136 RepID=A0A7K0FQN3_9SPHI|nr:DUF4199 domain-containing protein [Pedobacter puniceum]MRX47775.1 DUF4199 family protein [Pedobacter puniceum]